MRSGEATGLPTVRFCLTLTDLILYFILDLLPLQFISSKIKRKWTASITGI